jgi:hypothetical protein
MHGGRKRGIEICGVKSSRRPRHTSGCSAKQEEEEVEKEEILNKTKCLQNVSNT